MPRSRRRRRFHPRPNRHLRSRHRQSQTSARRTARRHTRRLPGRHRTGIFKRRAHDSTDRRQRPLLHRLGEQGADRCQHGQRRGRHRHRFLRTLSSSGQHHARRRRPHGVHHSARRLRRQLRSDQPAARCAPPRDRRAVHRICPQRRRTEIVDLPAGHPGRTGKIRTAPGTDPPRVLSVDQLRDPGPPRRTQPPRRRRPRRPGDQPLRPRRTVYLLSPLDRRTLRHPARPDPHHVHGLVLRAQCRMAGHHGSRRSRGPTRGHAPAHPNAGRAGVV